MAIMIDSRIEWAAPAPVWESVLINSQQNQHALQQLYVPKLLRFKSDAFMDELAQVLQSDPQQLSNYLAHGESFSVSPLSNGLEDNLDGTPLDYLKLYQPVHGFFYLLAASLVCRTPGLPDRFVNTAKSEKVSFVLRRIAPDGREMAWVSDPDPAQGKYWQVLGPTEYTRIVHGDEKTPLHEDVFPMFPLNFTLDGRKRRLFIGLVPTSSRETFQTAKGSLTISPFSGQEDNRLDEVISRVIDVVKMLKKYDDTILPPPSKLDPRPAMKNASSFALLDFANFLNTKLGSLWNVLSNDKAKPPTDNTKALFDQLNSAIVDTSNSGKTTWRQALKQVWDHPDRILQGDETKPAFDFNLKYTDIDPDALHANIQAALGTFQPPPAGNPYIPPKPVPAVPKLDPPPIVTTDPTTRQRKIGPQFVLRCVYQRPNCDLLYPAVVSNRTDPFVIAPFFDVDAPARPIRITMPVDTSIAGLRKFRKNVAVIISDKLRQQMECVNDLNSTLKGQLSCDASINLGTICSFSIPIITICALVVLLVFLILLNIVFWWLPFFRICFPINLKAKG